MGWGTTFNTEVYISKEILDTKDSAENCRDNLIDNIKEARTLLLMLVASSPKDITEKGEDPLWNVKLKAEDYVEEIIQNTFKLTQVNMLLDCFEKEDFKPITG
jgi:hypothetical protein